MPEIELRKDPLGANRGKSLREQAGILSGRVKQHLHDKYYIPPYRPTNRNWEMTFASLGYNRKTIEKFWRLFCQINHSSGAIQLEHFLAHFDLDWTPWTERCFKHFDTTGGGDIDFLEFMISVWNVCTFKIDSLSNFTFDMYDLDSDGELSIPEIERMIKELYGEDGGEKCLKEAIDFADARGGALNLNSFIAFTGSHQLLLFPIFQIQRKLQRRVFGIRFWEKIERSSKENFNDQNKNEFNPRHVQVLLRTYQTGGAAAVLSHTGDPNKGLREWYENQKQEDEADVDNEDENRPTGWNLLRERVNRKSNATQKWGSIKRNILEGEVKKQSTLGRIRDFKLRAALARKKDPNHDAANGAGTNASEENSTERPTSANLPSNVAADLQRIRARRTEKSARGSRPMDENDAPIDRPTSANLPANVADDLKRIRASRRNRATARNDPNQMITTPSGGSARPTSARPTSAGSASIPADVAEDLQRIRSRRTRRKANNDDDQHTPKAKRKDRRPRPRKSVATQNNVRRREAGSMFFKSETGSKGWLQ